MLLDFPSPREAEEVAECAPAPSSSTDPKDHFYESQGLRLHYADWGNEAAPPLLLIHGGRDHCRSWDAIARALQPHFHVMAPDLRGHGDSDWAKGSSYSLSEWYTTWHVWCDQRPCTKQQLSGIRWAG
jgi:pimeloyl-ACP methyl ester carboxylesterase